MDVLECQRSKKFAEFAAEKERYESFVGKLVGNGYVGMKFQV